MSTFRSSLRNFQRRITELVPLGTHRAANELPPRERIIYRLGTQLVYVEPARSYEEAFVRAMKEYQEEVKKEKESVKYDTSFYREDREGKGNFRPKEEEKAGMAGPCLRRSIIHGRRRRLRRWRVWTKQKDRLKEPGTTSVYGGEFTNVGGDVHIYVTTNRTEPNDATPESYLEPATPQLSSPSPTPHPTHEEYIPSPPPFDRSIYSPPLPLITGWTFVIAGWVMIPPRMCFCPTWTWPWIWGWL